VILAISGSLRRDSLNSAALRAAAWAAARTGVVIDLDDSARTLPHFDPDLETQPPEIVRRFREACERADAILLAVPEYAFGIPGTFKNALDWTVGSGAIYRKPIAVVSVAQPGRGAHVRHGLGLVFTALDCEIRDGRVIHELTQVVEALTARRQPRSDGTEPTLSA
jgi:chromate reductase, NAD(P)H dehydrogenase (quinone)